jgi:N-methylhydantoinase A
MRPAIYTLGIDVGGTFTDFALWDSERSVATLIKVPSTPLNQAEGIVHGIDELGCPLGEMERIVHGTQWGQMPSFKTAAPRLAGTTRGLGSH